MDFRTLILTFGIRKCGSRCVLMREPPVSDLLRYIKTTDLILAGCTKAPVDETITAAIDKKELPAMEPGAMCFMMSKHGYAGDTGEHWPPHLMFFYSETDPATWEAGLPGSPILGYCDAQEHLTTFVIAVQRWSDGMEDR